MRDEKKRTAWIGNAPGGNYTTKVQALADKMGVGVNDIDIAHDDWCALLKSGQPCNCDPDRTSAAVHSMDPAHTAARSDI
jgi:hypothetical protein